jgi:glycerol-3-phosphate dehydrogenase (NAD(P)+)
MVTPVAGLRPLAQQLSAQPIHAPVLWLCKGLEATSGCLPHEVLGEEWPQVHAGALSGPSFAQEVAAGLPVALTVASAYEAVAQAAVQAFHHGSARIYSTTDLIGVEVGGALKNVMAIATGISDGLGLGMNARAALLTRGLAEISRYGAALGARAETFIGLAGVGDLVLTCTGDLSRNRTVGLRLAKGETLPDILTSLGHVAEGVACCRAVCDRAQQLGVELPITQAVADVLFEGRAPRQAVAARTRRPPLQHLGTGVLRKLDGTAVESFKDVPPTSINLMLRSAPQERVSKHGHEHHACGPSFETALRASSG